MSRQLILAAAAMLAVSAGGAALATPAHHAQGGRVTTLKSDFSAAGDSQWRLSGDPSTNFTAVAVIQDGVPIPSVGTPQIGADSIAGAPPDALSEAARSFGDAPKGRGDLRTPSHAATGGISHLPEPSTWVLLIIGLGMIGFALRGIVAANRRLARLETPEA